MTACFPGPNEMIRLLLRCALVTVIGCLGLVAGEAIVSRKSLAEVFRTIDLADWLDGLALQSGARSMPPRTIRVNGQPVAFSAVTSPLPIADVVARWSQGREPRMTAARTEQSSIRDLLLAASARELVQIQTFAVSEERAAAVQFFDGDFAAAERYFTVLAEHGRGSGRLPPVPGVVLIASRSPDDKVTTVLQLRIDDVESMLTSYSRPAAATLPDLLGLPDGGTTSLIIEDKVGKRRSITMTASGAGTVGAWRDTRALRLELAGLTVVRFPQKQDGSASLSGKGNGLHVDAFIQRSPTTPGEVVEIVHVMMLSGG